MSVKTLGDLDDLLRREVILKANPEDGEVAVARCDLELQVVARAEPELLKR